MLKHKPAAELMFVVIMQMRHLYVVVDGSRTMEDQDLKPNRLTCTLKVFLYSKFTSLLIHSSSVNRFHFAFKTMAVSCNQISYAASSLLSYVLFFSLVSVAEQ